MKKRTETNRHQGYGGQVARSTYIFLSTYYFPFMRKMMNIIADLQLNLITTFYA